VVRTNPYWLDETVPALPALDRKISADAVVIGGGVAGLTVAQVLAERGADVVVIDESTCGSGATGRSSGFITPDSELQAAQLIRRFGPDDAGKLWRAASSACDHIRDTVHDLDIKCDFIEADSLYVAADRMARSTIDGELQARREVGLPSTHYSAEALPAVLGAKGFDAALRYSGTFAITPHRYATGLRDRLRSAGVRIFENSAAESVDGDRVTTARGRVRAQSIFLCADRHLARIGNARHAAFYVQTYLGATDPLPPPAFSELFPDGDLLVWDTDLIYGYFRRTADDRLLVGGGRLRDTYGPPLDGSHGIEHLRRYLTERIPSARRALFTHVWSGLIGVTKDFLPIAGSDRDHPNHFYAGCGAGVPWSVLAARCAVEAATGSNAFADFFDPHRAFTDLDPMQPVARKRATFALSHAYAKSALRGRPADVRRRRPIILAGLFAAAASLATAIVRRATRP
jgi:gamma-glutamylputrescine oxidase